MPTSEVTTPPSAETGPKQLTVHFDQGDPESKKLDRNGNASIDVEAGQRRVLKVTVGPV